MFSLQGIVIVFIQHPASPFLQVILDSNEFI